MEKKLRVDASSLWDEPDNQFVLRFNDLNETKQNKFTERFKKSAVQFKLRRPDGVNEQEISNFLKEINPVIFAEGMTSRFNSYAQQKRWNVFSISCLSGWRHKRLSQIVYRFLCVKKPPGRDEIKDALSLSTNRIEEQNTSIPTTSKKKSPHFFPISRLKTKTKLSLTRRNWEWKKFVPPEKAQKEEIQLLITKNTCKQQKNLNSK